MFNYFSNFFIHTAHILSGVFILIGGNRRYFQFKIYICMKTLPKTVFFLGIKFRQFYQKFGIILILRFPPINMNTFNNYIEPIWWYSYRINKSFRSYEIHITYFRTVILFFLCTPRVKIATITLLIRINIQT